MSKNGFLCVDCGFDTMTGNEYYMVEKAVWKKTGLGIHGGMLCIGCLENRLGRSLVSNDFMKCLLNDPDHRWNRMSDRLKDRMLTNH